MIRSTVRRAAAALALATTALVPVTARPAAAAPPEPAPAADGPTVESSAGSLVWDRRRGAYHLRWHGTFAKADIWFDHALGPG